MPEPRFTVEIVDVHQDLLEVDRVDPVSWLSDVITAYQGAVDTIAQFGYTVAEFGQRIADAVDSGSYGDETLEVTSLSGERRYVAGSRRFAGFAPVDSYYDEQDYVRDGDDGGTGATIDDLLGDIDLALEDHRNTP